MDIDAQELNEAENNLLQAFEWMWFDFPTPFGKGDIVVSKYSPWGWNLYADEPFVLMLLCSWGSNDIYYECMHHYLDLEYYREKPQGTRRILKAFSSFEKEEIDSDLLAIAYYTIMEEERIKQEKERLSCFTDEGLRLAGLK